MDELTRLTAALADRYQIEREIGRGGMATVYLARDLRHDRRIALKLLNPELGAVLGVERFLSEIRVTANLQHPNLLPLFDSGEVDGLLFYVMPYVDGESLRARIEREKQLPVDEAVRIATGVAAALDYAHRNGVIHRDLKPENILLQDGQPVIADFGIALAVSKAGGNRITQTGLSLGTPQYMSPEQATGDRTIDGRTDIYSLGAVTYEMLVGDPPHLGGTSQAIIAKLLTEKPRSVRATRSNVPPYVDAAVEHALEKLPADRFATAHEFSEALHGRGTVAATAATSAWSGGGATLDSKGARTRQVAVAALVFAIGVLSGALLWKRLGPTVEPLVHPLLRFNITLAHDAEPVAALSIPGSHIVISPDGGRIVYIGRSKTGHQLYSRSLDEFDASPIPGTEGGGQPFFSPDGRWIGFRQAGGHIAKVALAGGSVIPICDMAGRVFGMSWGTNDTIVFASDSGLEEVPGAGGRARLLARPDSGETFKWPDALPDGQAVLFSSFGPRGLKLAVFVRRSGAVKRLSQNGGYPQYVEGGFVVFADPVGTGTLFAAPFDTRRLDVTGSPVFIVDGLDVGPQGGRDVGVSLTGTITYLTTASALSRLVFVDRHGGVREAGSDTSTYLAPSLSPDGARVSLTLATSEIRNLGDVWIIDLIHHGRLRLTHDSTAGISIWTPDGKHVVYSRFAQGFGGDIYSIPVDGSARPESVVVAPGMWLPAGFFHDGHDLLYWGRGRPRSDLEIRQQPSGGRPSLSVLANEFDNSQPSLSPDGKWIAYQSTEAGRPEVYVRAFAGPGGRWPVSLAGGTAPIWSHTGREIFYRDGDRMMAAAVRTQPAFEVTTRTELFAGGFAVDRFVPNYDVTADGQTFVMLQPVKEATQSAVVLLNWFDRLHVRGK